MFWTDGTVHSVDFGEIMHGEVHDDRAQGRYDDIGPMNR
jgi:hypothetical protein